MIEHIKATATFVTPIKSWSFSGELSPPPGITAVIGRNGSGKSLLAVETPRYLLFGKKALRGMAADYSDFHAEGTFRLGGKRVHIKRTPRREQLTDLTTGVVEAVGADAVTAKVIELLGYGLDVFDLANAAVQKQTDKLGQLRASERKQLIDKVVGLATYETIEKACRDEAKKFKGVAEGLTSALRAPVEPVKPEGYALSTDIATTLTRARQLRVEHDRRENDTVQQVTAPRRPEGARVSRAQVDEAVTVQANADATARERARLQKIIDAAPKDAVDSEGLIAMAEARYEWEQLRDARGPQPTMTREEIEAVRGVWEEIDLRQRMSDEQAECPSCGTKFRVGGDVPTEPAVSRAALMAEHRAIENWATPLPPAPDDAAGSLAPGGARHARQRLAAYNAAVDAEAEIKLLGNPVQVHDLDGLRTAHAAWSRFDAQSEAFDAAVERARAAREKLEAWIGVNGKPMADDQLDELQERLTHAKIYEAAIERYDADVVKHAADTAAIAENQRRAEAYREGSTRLGEARATFKAHLAPMLSRIASSLIYDMSAGELSSVVVDDDMEITVDGQRIETLSGAGETVANLALRIALGQALVADAFPVFLGDEIDSDADEQRRSATKLALQRLKARLSQIILITHRAVDVADLVIDLDNPQELGEVAG